MKKRFVNIVKSLVNFLQNILNKYSIETEVSKDYFHSLSPINSADEDGSYCNALNWALSNRKKEDIKNIALTGPYGSGKSSILKTFQKNNKNNDLRFLHISLATFKEEIEPKNPQKKEDLLRLLELSILQQIFYHEKDETIPDSRFKKIKSVNKRKLNLIGLALFVSIIAVTNLISPNLINILFPNIGFNYTIKLVVHYTSLTIGLIAFSYLIFKSIRILTSVKIEKLNIQNAEIKINDSVGKSILNHHLDEILYFFEVTKSNIVIIEDLDRFKQTEIFTKLRELNLLINNSQKIQEDVVFIYAVRDEMFIDKDRTKFFDFIIPIIPVINSSNSNEKFAQNIKDNGYNISEDLIEDISLFIDDMRLLHNITNEYHIYHQKLSKQLNQNNLLSMIVYKNIYPNDFIKLNSNEGELYRVLFSKQEFIKTEVEKINDDIVQLKNRISQIEPLQVKNIQELRSIYLLNYSRRVPYIHGFKIGDKNYDLKTILTDNEFTKLVTNQVQVITKVHNVSYGRHDERIIAALDFKEIEKEVDPNYTYSEREQQIKDYNAKVPETLKKKIVELEKEKNRIKTLKIKEILSRGDFSIEMEDKKQNQLISILLRNGYIDEDYLDYISIFYPGSISKEDNFFLLNVKSQIPTKFDFKLSKAENLIKKIYEFDFEKPYVLNYSLVAELLKTNVYGSKRELLFQGLKNESENSVSFIDGYIDFGENIQFFIKELCKAWINIWNYIQEQSSFTSDKKMLYLKLIVQFADLTDIKNISTNSNLSKIISENYTYLSLIEDKAKFKDVIKTLNIKFSDFDNIGIKDEMIDFAYQGDYYKINIQTLIYILKTRERLKQDEFDDKNYSAIIGSGCKELMTYLDKNIEEYINNVYLKLDLNNNEPEAALVLLLNNENISFANRVKIIEKVNTKISDLAKISHSDINEILLQNSKIEPIWENLLKHYVVNQNVFSESFSVFFNYGDNSKKLSNSKIPKEDPDIETCKAFIKDLLKCEEIENENYSVLLSSVPYSYNSLEFEVLSDDKVILLIQNNKLNLTGENYKLLKESFDDLHIKLLEQKHSEFIENMGEYVIDEKDIISLLKSLKFSIDEKGKLINYINEAIIVSNIGILESIGHIILTRSSLEVSKNVVQNVLIKTQLTTSQKIRILNAKESVLDSTDIEGILNSLPEPYSDINGSLKRPLIPMSNENLELTEILKNRNYISKYDEEKNGIRISTYKREGN